MLPFVSLLSQVGSNASSAAILGGAEVISNNVSQAWDRTWDIALSGGLYGAINNIGIFLAAGALVFWLLDFVRKWLSDEVNGVWALQDLIWPVIIILFTANNGALLAGFSRGFRDTLNDFNLQVVRVVAKEQDLEKTLNELGAYAVIDAKLVTARGQCNTITDNKRLTQCLDEQNKALQGILQQYQQEYGLTVKYKQLEASVKEGLRNPGEALVDGVRTRVNNAVNLALSPAMALVIVFMAACQYCFQQLIEVSMLLTAIMGPLALSASLLPFGAKPIFAWLTAFWSLSLLKLSYNVIAGLTAIAIYQTSGTETLGSAIFFGLFSPLLAIAMAAGGGLAVFNGILAASGAGGAMAVSKIAALGGGGGGGGAAAAAASKVIGGADGA
jgi:hypothetical protein